MGRKLVLAVVSALVLVSVLASFGVSNTGLFHLPALSGEGKEETDYDGSKWDFVGNVSVEVGGVSRLGT